MDRDLNINLNEYDLKNLQVSVGRSTQFSTSPWNRMGQK